MPGRVRLEVLELLDDAEPARRRLDPADRLVAGLLVVPPRARLATVRDGLDALDDRVVRVHVAVEAPDLPVGDDVDAGGLHVADRHVAVGRQHLLADGGARPRALAGGMIAGASPSKGSSSTSSSGSSARARAIESIFRSPPLSSGPLRPAYRLSIGKTRNASSMRSVAGRPPGRVRVAISMFSAT